MFDSIGKAFVLSVKAVKILCIIALFNIVLNLANLVIIPAPVDAEMDIKTSLTVLGAFLLFLLLMLFIRGGILVYIKELVKTGSASLASFMGNCAKYFIRMAAIMLLMGLIFLGWNLIFLGILPLFLPLTSPALLIVIGLIVNVVLLLLLILSGYALVGGDLGPVAAMRKGVSISVENFLKIVVISVILLITFIVATFIAVFLIGLLSIALKPILNYIVAVVMAISSGIVTLLADIAYMDFYLKKS